MGNSGRLIAQPATQLAMVSAKRHTQARLQRNHGVEFHVVGYQNLASQAVGAELFTFNQFGVLRTGHRIRFAGNKADTTCGTPCFATTAMPNAHSAVFDGVYETCATFYLSGGAVHNDGWHVR